MPVEWLGEPEWDGTRRVMLTDEPRRSERERLPELRSMSELYSAVREGRARLGAVTPGGTREIIFRGQPTGRYVSLEFANRVFGASDEAPVIDPFEGSIPLGSAHPDGQSIRTMVDSVEMPK